MNLLKDIVRSPIIFLNTFLLDKFKQTLRLNLKGELEKEEENVDQMMMMTMSKENGGINKVQMWKNEIKGKKEEGDAFLRSLIGEKKSTEFSKTTKPFFISKNLISHLEDTW